MHELAICQALIGEVVEVANAERAASVSDVYVSVGPLSGAEMPLLQNAFPVAAAGTVADRATLHLEQAPVRVHCTACGDDSDAAVNRLVCAHCGDWRTTLVSGDELILKRVVFDRSRRVIASSEATKQPGLLRPEACGERSVAGLAMTEAWENRDV